MSSENISEDFCAVFVFQKVLKFNIASLFNTIFPLFISLSLSLYPRSHVPFILLAHFVSLKGTIPFGKLLWVVFLWFEFVFGDWKCFHQLQFPSGEEPHFMRL